MKVKIDSSEFANMILLLKKGKPSSFVLTEEDITISLPEDNDTSVVWEKDDPNKRPLDLDTKVLITAKPTSPRYIRNANYFYRRINIERQWLILAGTKEVTYTSEMISSFTKENIKAYIDKRMKYIPTSLIFTYTAFDDSEGTATVTINPIANSYVYKGELVLTFKKKETDDRIPLQTAIPNNELDGYDYFESINIDPVNILGYNYSGRPNP